MFGDERSAQSTFHATDMIRTLALVCFLAAPALGFWDPGFKVKFGLPLFGNSFTDMPQSNTSAAALGWVQKDRAKGPTGLESLVLWCPSDSCTLCLLFDDTGYPAGLQLAFEKSRVSKPAFDWEIQGYTNWTTTQNGETKYFYITTQYYISSEILSTMDAETRISSRNSSQFLQHGAVWVTGFHGKLFNISTNPSDFTGSDSIYTRQSCIPMMGTHYYYNVTTSSTCASDTMLPWFAVVDNGQLVGVGFYFFGIYSADTNSTDYFEYSGKGAMLINVPYASQCVYDLAESPGQVTEHIYFINTPQLITCLL